MSLQFFFFFGGGEIDLRVKLRYCTVKKLEIGKVNLNSTDNRLYRNECSVGQVIKIYESQMISRSHFDYAVIDKSSEFQKIGPMFTYSPKS